MANANQVIVNGETILDLRSDTVAPAALQKGYTAHDKSGTKITGTLAGAYYVELDGEFPGYTLSETTPLADIVAAYNEGKALFCRGYSNANFTIELPLLSAFSSESIFIFSGSHCADNTGALPENTMITIAVAESGVYCEYQEYLARPNIVTSVSAESTDSEVPSAKCLYDLVGDITAQIDAM